MKLQFKQHLILTNQSLHIKAFLKHQKQRSGIFIMHDSETMICTLRVLTQKDFGKVG